MVLSENMEFLKEKANDAAHTAARGAKLLALISKKKIAILNEQEKIRRAYTRLGKVYYKDYVTDEEPDEAEYNPLCEKISVSYRRINRFRAEIAEAKAEYHAVTTESEPNDEAVTIVPYVQEEPSTPEEPCEIEESQTEE